ncbi:MAG TPA: lysine--tRNA ligase, partial [Candidatus Binatia bacterium]|nr:lysine--tRNA ligase [Candidatus Binatia bacterium]
MAENAPSPGEDTPEQVEVRKQKLEKLKSSGATVYPNDFRPTHSASALVNQFNPASDDELSAARLDLRVAGRIMAIRRMGKASFFHV